MKQCSSCHVIKPLTLFSPSVGNKDGYRGQCKECLSEIAKRRHITNYVPMSDEERSLKTQKRKQDRDARESLVKAERERRTLEKERTAPQRELERKLKAKEAHRRHIKKKRSVPFARRVEKNNVKHKHLGKLSNDIVDKLLIQQNYLCVYCKVDITNDRHIDHTMPVAKGGTNTDDNIQLLCPSCNIAKGDMFPWEFAHLVVSSLPLELSTGTVILTSYGNSTTHMVGAIS